MVYATASYRLGAGIENLYLTGTGAINGIGNVSNNVIYGNSGNNILDGSLGSDYLVGGAGVDTFVLHRNQGLDTIADFAVSEKFRVAVSEFGGGLVAGVLKTAQFLISTGTQANTISQRFVFDTTSRSLYFDGDGSGAGTAVQIAKLNGIGTVTASSFVLI